MLDYVKLHVEGVNIERLLTDPQFDFTYETSRSTGEIGRWYVTEYHHCKISIYEHLSDSRKMTRVIFAGSIHKMWNSLNGTFAPNYNKRRKYTGFNGNDFTLANVIAMLRHVADLFGCTLDEMIFENVEFGLNVHVQFGLRLFLKGLLYHRNILFEFQHGRNSAQAKHQRYIFKIYNKSFQYGMKYDVLRVELKYMKMIDLNSVGLRSAGDVSSDCLNRLCGLLKSKISEILYYDFTIDDSELKKTDKNALLRFSNIHYWMDMPSSQRDRPKKKLSFYIENYSENQRQKLLIAVREKFVLINRAITQQKDVSINHVGISIETTKKNSTRCLVTGMDISMQKSGSLLLSNAGLKFYQKNAPEIFRSLKGKFLTSTWQGSDNQKQIEEIAHNIRTHRKNAKRKQRRLYSPNQSVMFDIKPINECAT